jgi:hypothetical protein
MNRRTLLSMAPVLALATQAKAAPDDPPMATCCPIVELRQYTLHAGGRDVLIDLFEREFVETQEAVGVRVIGTFRDLDDPNRFVWLRGFPDMAARAKSLEAFYSGPAWQAHRNTANATMIDSDNVLLLHPTTPEAGFAATDGHGDGLVVAEIRYLDTAKAVAFQAFAAQRIIPRMRAAGARVLATFATEASPNSFPKLPVRQGETVHVTFLGFSGEPAHRAWRDALAAGPDWRDGAPEALLRDFSRKPEVIRLSPTKRSRLRG